MPQLESVATAVALPLTEGSVDPGHDVKLGGQEIAGAELQAQFTVTEKLAVAVCPQASTAV